MSSPLSPLCPLCSGTIVLARHTVRGMNCKAIIRVLAPTARPSLLTSFTSVWCSANAASLVSRHHATTRLFTCAVADLITSLPLGPIEIPAVGLVPCVSATSAVEARLASPSASALKVTSVPARMHTDRPLEVELAANGLGVGADAAVSVASWISDHALLQLSVEAPGQPQGEVALRVQARPSGGGWIIRALVRPAAWADAASITVVSLSLAGRPLTSDLLLATLRVGYNHDPAPVGVVYAAAKAGDVAALQAALDAGGSTEEADVVSGGGGSGGRSRVENRQNFPSSLSLPFFPFLPSQVGRTAAYCAACFVRLEALRMLLAEGANPAAADRVSRGDESRRWFAWGLCQGARGRRVWLGKPSIESSLGCVRAACR